MDQEKDEHEKTAYWKIPLYIVGIAVVLLLAGTVISRFGSAGSFGAALRASWPIQ